MKAGGWTLLLLLYLFATGQQAQASPGTPPAGAAAKQRARYNVTGLPADVAQRQFIFQGVGAFLQSGASDVVIDDHNDGTASLELTLPADVTPFPTFGVGEIKATLESTRPLP